MTLYRLSEWEENGYHDSYGYMAYYDSEKGELGQVNHWATAYAGGLDTSAYLSPTPEALEGARQLLEAKIYARLVADDQQRVFQPTDKQLEIGTKVRTTKGVRNKDRETATCPKCNGSGHWVNPRNSEDKRQCFKCHGTGQVQGKSTGKFVKIPEGTVGEVIDRYQYNSRSVINWTIRAEDGSLFRCGCGSLRLDRELQSEQHWRKRAFELSFHFSFKSVVTSFGGWLSTDWAGPVAQRTYKGVCPHCGQQGRVKINRYNDSATMDCCGIWVQPAHWYQRCWEANHA